MPSAEVTIPPDLREPVRRELLSLYAVKSEALHAAVETALEQDTPLQEALEHRAELEAVATLIDRFGWDSDLDEAAVEAEADPALLAEIVIGALGTEVEALHSGIEGRPWAEVDLEAVRSGLERVERPANGRLPPPATRKTPSTHSTTL